MVLKSTPSNVVKGSCFIIGSGIALSGASMVRGEYQMAKAMLASLRRQHAGAALFLISVRKMGSPFLFLC